MKTARFATIVAESGKPESYTLWVAPEKDHAFQAALKAGRVMTVHRHNIGGKADFGQVGFVPDTESTLLIFPKSLKKFTGSRVIGIAYDLLEPLPEDDAAPKERELAKKQQRRTEAAKDAPRAESDAPPPPRSAPAARIARTPKEFAPLRVVEPEKKVEAPAKHGNLAHEARAGQRCKALTSEVRKALKKLEQGNSVAAYRILEKAISP